MKEWALVIAKTVIDGMLNSKREEPLFSITCIKCGCSRELEYYFSKMSGDIEIFNEKDMLSDDKGDVVVSIHCTKYGNHVNSSDY
ncbi:hypothetical protein DV702_08610 [Sporosarcina sp. PTS2304]|uniref:hypothetical protein n=1 Tax=Sporosarcina sp. PTS2304 TaxID=2283194 RepID=UPI000E0D16DE|nr:hypothetical protein [Sporosarcina sp. PTS2304]AXH99788.1 hypothetical protein DV702_08610 [Sporosarcina sp. PTS2304]